MKKVIKYNEQTLENTCYACPTSFDFEDVNGKSYYFRLRHGWFRLDDETESRTICEGSSDFLGLDGICSWQEALLLMASQGVFLIGEYKQEGT